MFMFLWAVVATLVALLLFLRGKFADKGSAIFVCPSRQVLLAMVALCDRCGIKPRFRIDSPGKIERAMMSNGWIFNNVIDPAIQQRMGNPMAAFAVATWSGDPEDMAYKAADFLEGCGLQGVRILRDVDPGVPRGKMCAVLFSEGHERFCVIFRKHFLKMGPQFGQKPPAWTWDK